MSAIELFQYESAELRTVVRDGEPWFVGRDVCAILGLSNIADSLNRLDEDGVANTDLIDSMGRKQNARIVSEPGLYELVFQSRKPEAKKFRRWVTAEVLPAIRKTGNYGAPAIPTSRELAQLVIAEADRADAAEAKVVELEPKAEFYDELMDSNGCYSMLAASKMIGWGRNVMMRDLRRMGVLQGNNLPYQRYEHHFKVVPGTYVNRKTGETVPTATVFVLPKGVEFLRQKLAKAPAVVSS